MERYIKEYAAARIKELKDNKLIQTKYEQPIIERIEKALKFRKAGHITPDEAIRIILEA